MTRLWMQGKPIQVKTANHRPISLQRDTTWHSIMSIVLEWQIDVDWWRIRLYRNYYKVLTKDGFLLVIYHDLISDSWMLQRIYD